MAKHSKPITRQSMSKLVIQPSWGTVDHTHTKLQKPFNKRQIYDS